LDADGNAYFDNLRGAKESLIYYFGDEEEIEYHPSFTFQGFQYARIASWPGVPRKEDFVAQVVHSYMEPTGSFECSNPDVNQLHHNVLWGLKGNFVDVPTDCPQRNERLGWTGDAQIFSRTASYLMNTYEFFSKWLVDVAADQTEEGGVAHVVPNLLNETTVKDDWLLSQGTHSAAAWADVAVIMPWSMYMNFGDREIIKKQYPSMKAWIDFMKNHAVDDIWNYKLQFGDWVALDAEEGSYFGATPNDLTCTAYYAYSTGLFVKMAESIGQTEDVKEYSALYQRIVEKSRDTFFLPDGSMTVQTQTAHILALYFNLAPVDKRDIVVNALLKLLEKENGHLVTGFVGTPYFCHALSQNGHTKEAYELLLKEDFPSWLYQVKMGATTIWEHWDGKKPDGSMWSADMNSFNHYAYGAIAEWLYRVVGGIDSDERNPGFKHSIIYPHISDNLKYAETKYETPYGLILTRWEINNNNISLQVFVPHNTTAQIILDGAVDIIHPDGLDFTATDGSYQAKAGSGRYQIEYRK
jgi:alpha-L-rhamnosidase